MNIASIDPGQTTGAVICRFDAGVDLVNIRKQDTYSLQQEHLSTFLESLRKEKCRLVVMEDKPSNPHKQLLEAWNFLYYGLLEEGYRFTNSKMYDTYSKNYRMVFLIPPSQWKPFMKARNAINKNMFSKMKTKHEKDAAQMLQYFLQINHPTKEIYYVKN